MDLDTDIERLDLFPEGKLEITLRRLCQQLIETYGNFENTVMLGAQPRGVYLGRRIQKLLKQMLDGLMVPYGDLDVTFYRDDFRKRSLPLQPNQTQIDFLIEEKHVILIDDVLFTGRTVRAAMDAMLAFGRPQSVALLVLVDRKRKRHLPIEASYIGIQVDTIETQRVLVELKESGGNDEVVLISQDS